MSGNTFSSESQSMVVHVLRNGGGSRNGEAVVTRSSLGGAPDQACVATWASLIP